MHQSRFKDVLFIGDVDWNREDDLTALGVESGATILTCGGGSLTGFLRFGQLWLGVSRKPNALSRFALRLCGIRWVDAALRPVLKGAD